MCNAYNHPPDCDCGWGGIYHPNMSGYELWSPKAHKENFISKRIHEFQFDKSNPRSYTIRNSYCPVCGEDVYFYRSENDGRVFFDELGPPWPKHPCTDSSRSINEEEEFQLKKMEWFEIEYGRLSDSPKTKSNQKAEPIALRRISSYSNYTLYQAKEIIGFGETVRFLVDNSFKFLETSLLFMEKLNPIDYRIHYFQKNGKEEEYQNAVEVVSLSSSYQDTNKEDTVRFSKLLLRLGHPGIEELKAFMKNELGFIVEVNNTNQTRIPLIVSSWLLDEFIRKK